jgi:tetratricopeptide (TPR) repeat protein
MSLSRAYWIGLAVCLFLGSTVQIPGLALMRFRFNKLLAQSLSFMDLELDPQLIYELDLSAYLHSASRLGRYADFLSHKWVVARRKQGGRSPASRDAHLKHGKDPNQLATQASEFFQRALALDPNHTFNLSRHAAHLLTLGNEGEASRLLSQALRLDPENKEALEANAALLNDRGDPAALTYFQRALMQVRDRDSA